MPAIPPPVADFLAGKRIAVAGVSRGGKAPANAIFRRLAETGHEAIPINPNASELEGVRAYPDLASVPGTVDGLLFAAHPSVAERLVHEAAARGIRHVWLHRSFGEGSVSEKAVAACRAAGFEPIVGGCPLMYIAPVDPAHRFFRWWLRLLRRVPG
jgi:uncharacterized protein